MSIIVPVLRDAVEIQPGRVAAIVHAELSRRDATQRMAEHARARGRNTIDSVRSVSSRRAPWQTTYLSPSRTPALWAKWAVSAMAPRNDDARILTMATKREATVEDLYHVPGKAEIVNGELVSMPLTGDAHGRAVLRIVVSLYDYERRTKRGRAYGDNVGFLVRLPNRRSFSPDAAFYEGPSFAAKFIEGAPVFAVEVRSEEDYGPAAERAMAAKRADYFAAGSFVVWDVDVLREQCIRVYRAKDPASPATYRRGDVAEAEPALPEWTFPVDDLFLTE